MVNLFAGAVLLPPLPEIKLGDVGKTIADVLDLEDDYVGENSTLVFDLITGETRDQLHARVRQPLPKRDFEGAVYTHSFEVVGNPEGRYKLYFRLDMVSDPDNQPL